MLSSVILKGTVFEITGLERKLRFALRWNTIGLDTLFPDEQIQNKITNMLQIELI